MTKLEGELCFEFMSLTHLLQSIKNFFFFSGNETGYKIVNLKLADKYKISLL